MKWTGKANALKALLVVLMILCLTTNSKWQVNEYESPPYQQKQLQFEHASSLSPSPIDDTVEQSLAWENIESRCDEILLYLPDASAGHGHGWQINIYLMAAAYAAFMNKALVILEPPRNRNRYDTFSQFGCPLEETFEDETHSKVKDGFPEGLSRLIEIPTWISRGCKVPTCGGTTGYNEWNLYRNKYRQGRHSRWPDQFDCTEGDRNVKVTPMDAGDIRRFFDNIFRDKMVDRTSPNSKELAYGWATRFGATPKEAQYFSNIEIAEDIWAYITALANRSGLLRLQPWVARDVEEYRKTSDLPPNASYDAIHVRRGDKLLKESGAMVAWFWKGKGYNAPPFPTNYIPFSRYIEMGWGGLDCPSNFKHARRRRNRTPTRIVYVATDDPGTVRKEIDSMPKVRGGYTIINPCLRAKFVFSPATRTTTQFHLTPCGKYRGKCSDDNCFKRYKRTIAAIADMMILSRADMFIGDYNSNWGRLIKGFRASLNNAQYDEFDSEMSTDPHVLVNKVVDVSNWMGKFTPFGY